MLVHVNIVSGQALPNLIPVLMERPGKVYLVATEAMENEGLAHRLKSVIQAKGISAEIIRGSPDADLRSVVEFARLKVAERLRKIHPQAELVLNASGGTKPMVLGFVDAFRERGARIIYTDTAHGRIEGLPGPGEAAGRSIPMKDVLDVGTYLAAQGFAVRGARSDDRQWREQAESRRTACAFLADRIKDRGVQNLVGALNGLAHKALEQRRLVAPEQAFESEPRAPWPEVLDRLRGFGLLSWSGTCVRFADESSACFLHGDWLEEYVWHVVGDAHPFDVRLGVQGRWDGGRSAENEFDVLATHGNELLFIECKTLKHGREEAKDADLLYKADSLGHDARGVFGTTWLVTARSPAPGMLDRAHQQGVTLIGPTDIAGLAGRVGAWIAGRPSRH